MATMSDEEFERVIEEALDAIPDHFLEALENVAVVMQDEPDEEQLDYAQFSGWYDEEEDGADLLGLYDGVPLTERSAFDDTDAPDVITVFKGPHERCFGTREELVEEIGRTVIHEIGHYFGLDDARLHEMGY